MSLKNWFLGRNRREQILLISAGILAAAIIAIYGITLPLLSAISQEKKDYLTALDGRIATENAVKSIMDTPIIDPSTPMGDQLGGALNQSAAEAGFTIDQIADHGGDGIDISIINIRPTALFKWLNAWEMRGLLVKTISIRRGDNDNISVTATLIPPVA